MDPFVEGSLDWAPLVHADLEQLLELRTAVEYLDDPVERLAEGDLVEHFSAPGADPQANGVVGRDKGGTIVAYGWNLPRGLDVHEPRIWLDGAVHPAWRFKHIGRQVLAWQLARAKEWYAEALADQPDLPPVWVGRYVDEKLTHQASMVQRMGLELERCYFDMHVTFRGEEGDNTALPPFPDTDGITIEPYHPRLSERVRLAHNEAFSALPGAHSVSTATWDHWMSRAASRPQWSWVATVGDEVVGYAMNSAYEQDWAPQGFSEGWTDRLGVRPGWRGHNLGRALLVASMRSFTDAGLEGAGLGIDTSSPARALRLFEAIGYESEEMVSLYGCRFGADDVVG